ncbi:MAG: ABC transporter ATP-binding protein, partial [Oscillospiraceae bacterium]|nr:ABC transporter ATP-binding protein [Oscillospiraceae bacterium]
MIEIRQMRSGYGGRSVIEIEKSLFCEGNIVSVVGKNGCGKSTLLKTLAGMLPYSGSIDLCGRQLRELPGRQRAGLVSYLPQSLTAPDMTVATLVSHGRFSKMGFSKALSRHDRDIIGEAMDIAQVSSLSERRVKDLSGGERQRSFMAMVIAQDAEFLLMDEPSTYMDIEHQMTMWQVLGELRRRGKGIIIVSHDIPQCFSNSDSVLVMDGGRVLSMDSTLPPSIT